MDNKPVAFNISEKTCGNCKKYYLNLMGYGFPVNDTLGKSFGLLFKCPNCNKTNLLVLEIEEGRIMHSWGNASDNIPEFKHDKELSSESNTSETKSLKGGVIISEKEYLELKEKAGKWDLSQLMTMELIYGTRAFDFSDKVLDEPTEKELTTAIMKALSGAIKNEGLKITKKSCHNCYNVVMQCGKDIPQGVDINHDTLYCDGWKDEDDT